jgi:hypothetical protein
MNDTKYYKTEQTTWHVSEIVTAYYILHSERKTTQSKKRKVNAKSGTLHKYTLTLVCVRQASTYAINTIMCMKQLKFYMFKLRGS